MSDEHRSTRTDSEADPTDVDMDLPSQPAGLSGRDLQELSEQDEVRVAERPDGSRALVKIQGVEDLVHTDRLTGADGEPYSLRFVVGYDAKAVGTTLSPSMIDELIEMLEAHRAAFEEVGR